MSADRDDAHHRHQPSSSASSEDLLPETTRYLDFFVALAEVAKVLTGSLERREVLQGVMRHLTQLLRPANWSLLLADRKTDELQLEIAVGPRFASLERTGLDAGRALVEWVLEHGEPVLCEALGSDERFEATAREQEVFGDSSMMCAPLVCRGEILGVIWLVKGEDETTAYAPEDLRILQPFADFAAIAIDNARSFAAVQELTIRDDWTGLYNARFLERYLEAEVARARRYNSALSIVFFDLDYFKAVNDAHGHAVGSQTLAAVATIVQGCIRETDRAIRYGGDEFVVVLPETGRAGARTFAERVRATIAKTGFDGPDGAMLHLTASFGVAEFAQDGGDASRLLEAADRAMYAAKEAGRDTVRGADEV